MIKTAEIMAAGMGTRFGKYTEQIPKGFVEVCGKPMIERSIETLISCGIERIVIGTGYKHEVYDFLKKKYPMIETCFSPLYAETNSMYTLYNTQGLIGSDDFLLLESDLVFETKAITELMNCGKPDVMLATPITKFQDQYYVEFDTKHHLTACSTQKENLNVKGELVGIHKISSTFFKEMCKDYGRILSEQPKLGYEYELLRISMSTLPLFVLVVEGLKWYEIDDLMDLAYAEIFFK